MFLVYSVYTLSLAYWLLMKFLYLSKKKKKMPEIIIKGKWRGKTFLHENATSLLSKVHIKVET